MLLFVYTLLVISLYRREAEFLTTFFLYFPLLEDPGYEYSGSEDEEDEVAEEEGEPR